MNELNSDLRLNSKILCSRNDSAKYSTFILVEAEIISEGALGGCFPVLAEGKNIRM